MDNDNKRRVTRTSQLSINARPVEIFPLLCPVREAEYLDDWRYEMIHSHSGVAEKGCIFQTPNEGGEPSTWIITEHNAETGRIQFAILTPASHASTLDVVVKDASGGRSDVTFTYAHAALSQRGIRFIESFTEAAFRKKMSVIEESLNRFVAQGAQSAE